MTPSQHTRFINWLAMPIALVVTALVAYHAYQRHIVGDNSAANYQFDDLPSYDKTTLQGDINAIVSRHIFGVEPKAPEPVSPVVVEEAPVVKEAPKTPLNIKLTGVIDGDSPEQGIAMIEVERGKTLVVAVGEKIGKTGAVLDQVLPGEILIDRLGSIESVKMVRKSLSMSKLGAQQLNNLPQPYVDENTAKQQNGDAASMAAFEEVMRSEMESELSAPNRAEEVAPMSRLPMPKALNTN